MNRKDCLCGKESPAAVRVRPSRHVAIFKHHVRMNCKVVEGDALSKKRNREDETSRHLISWKDINDSLFRSLLLDFLSSPVLISPFLLVLLPSSPDHAWHFHRPTSRMDRGP
eukprot:755642-Hanusia_phi.AAC.6